jgi:hypothetical protein
VDPRDDLDDVEKRKFLTTGTRTPTSSDVQPVAIPYTDYAIPAPHRWEDNIKMALREVGYEDVDWINLRRIRDSHGVEY